MTPKQRVFADEYIKTRNATRAYMMAYPNSSEECARKNAPRLKANEGVSAYIEQRLDEISSAAIMDAAEIMAFYSAVARGKEGETLIDNRGEEHVVPSRMSDRLNAAERLSKMLGVDKKADTGSGGGGVIIVDDV